VSNFSAIDDNFLVVMAGLVPAISLRDALAFLNGMPGTRPGMTSKDGK